MRTHRAVLCVSALAFLPAGLAFAADIIPIDNPSFEDDSEHAFPVPWYWQGAGEKATFVASNVPQPPDASSLIARMSNGSYNFYDPGDGGQSRAAGLSNIEQTLTTFAAPSTTYTLTVDAINTNGTNPLYPIKLVPLLHHADGTALGGMTGDNLLSFANEPSPVLLSTTWSTLNFTWTTNGTESGAQALRIGFTVDNSQPGGTVGFDNIRLTATTALPYAWQLSNSGNWNDANNWSTGIVPNAVDATARFLGSITSPQTVFTNTAVTVGAMTFDNANTYVIAGAGSLTVAVSSGSGSINVLQGSHKINLPLTFASNTNVDVAAGASLTIGNPTTINANTTVTKSGNLLIQAPLKIEAGGALVLASGPTTAFGAPSLGSGARIDVKNNSMTIDYSGLGSPAGTVKAQLTSGYASGAWTGEGINTSSAVANQTALGWKDDAATQSLLVKYTYYGDANLDGQVDISDLGALATAWQTSAVWSQGDFDYSGFVDISDLGSLATNWQAGVGSPLGPSFDEALASVGLAGVSVPEPTALALLAVGAVLIGRRRRVAS